MADTELGGPRSSPRVLVTVLREDAQQRPPTHIPLGQVPPHGSPGARQQAQHHPWVRMAAQGPARQRGSRVSHEGRTHAAAEGQMAGRGSRQRCRPSMPPAGAGASRRHPHPRATGSSSCREEVPPPPLCAEGPDRRELLWSAVRAFSPLTSQRCSGTLKASSACRHSGHQALGLQSRPGLLLLGGLSGVHDLALDRQRAAGLIRALGLWANRAMVLTNQMTERQAQTESLSHPRLYSCGLRPASEPAEAAPA